MKKQECKLILDKKKGSNYYRINVKELLKMFTNILRPSDLLLLTKKHIASQSNQYLYSYSRYSRYTNYGSEMLAKQKQWNLMRTIYTAIMIPYVSKQSTTNHNILFRGMEICIAQNTPFVIFKLFKENPFSYYSRPYDNGIILYNTRTEMVKILRNVVDLKYVCHSLKEYSRGNKTLIELDTICTIPFSELNGDKLYERTENN